MLLEFYGKECSHCMKMQPLIERLIQEENVTIERYEVWHNPEHAKKMEEYDKGLCGGVPFFYNTQSGAAICGEAPYEELRKWALGK